jgi:hypothetical protein
MLPGDGEPPGDRSLITWAEELGRPWALVVDNECTYWGGLGDIMCDALLRWFCGRHPVGGRWQDYRFDTRLARILHRGLFDHGWTRNHDQVVTGMFPRIDLWGGLHARSILEHQPTHALSSVQRGLRLTLRGLTWTSEELEPPTPLDAETGRVRRDASP